MDYLGKGEVLTNTDLWIIFERNRPFVYIEKVLDLWVQLMKNGGKKQMLRLYFWSVYEILHHKTSLKCQIKFLAIHITNREWSFDIYGKKLTISSWNMILT